MIGTRFPASLRLACAIVLAAVAPAALADFNITSHPQMQNEVSLAVNPADSARLVAAYIDSRSSDYRVAWSWSDNGGASWTFGGSAALPGYARTVDPVVAFDSAGTAYLSGLAYNPDTAPNSLGKDGSVFLAKSNDGGHSFGVFQKIVTAGVGTANHLDKPWLFVNLASNHVYLAWVKRVNAWNVGGDESATIWFARSTDGGLSFAAPLQVSTLAPATGTNRSHGPQITATSASNVFVSWHTLEAGTLPNPPTTPWKIWIVASTNGGANFGANQSVATSAWGYPNRFISMDADPATGRIYIAYADSLVQTPRDYDVFVTSATSAAGPWTTPRKINDDPAGTGRWQTWPALDVAPNGRVDVIWYDYRDDAGNANASVYYSASSDGGSTWTPNAKLSSAAFAWPTGFFGDYSSVAASADRTYGAWMDNRLGNQEVYGAAVIHPPGGASVPKPPTGLRIAP